MSEHRYKAAICEHGRITGGAMYPVGDTAEEERMLGMLGDHRTIEDRSEPVTIEGCGECRRFR